MYQGNSIVDYLKSTGQATDYASRATLASSKGIQGYTGSASQNTQLLNILRGSPAPQPTIQQTAKPAVAQQTAQTTAQPQGGGVTPEGIPVSSLPADLQYNGQLDISNPDKQTKYNQLVQQFKNNTPQGGATAGVSFNTPQINLPEIYDSLYKSSGISESEAKLASETRAFNDAQSKINDNPYLSEASRTGRLQKLQNDFNASSQATRDEIATKKADVEMKLNMQLKQFDINSQQAQQALQEFQTLLSSGALTNATGEDIANITRSTGLSSSMIKSAIDANNKKNVQTSTIQFDDGTNQGFAVINSNTGEIINKQVISQSKPEKASATSTKEADLQATQSNLLGDIQRGATLKELINHYAVAGGLSPEEIYRIYNSNSPYGKAKESLDQVKEGKFTV